MNDARVARPDARLDVVFQAIDWVELKLACKINVVQLVSVEQIKKNVLFEPDSKERRKAQNERLGSPR